MPDSNFSLNSNRYGSELSPVELMMLKHLISPEGFLTDAQGRLNILNMQLIQDKINVIIREAKCGELQKQQKQALNELILLKNKLNATNSTWDI